MKRASVAELKARLSEYLAAAKRGEDVIVTDRGRPVAKLTSLTGQSGLNARVEQLVREGLMRLPRKKLPADFLTRPRPNDPEGKSLRAVLEEREEGW